MTELRPLKARFHEMAEGTQDDWNKIVTSFKPFAHSLSYRIMAHMRLLRGDDGGFAIDRLEHCLQTATRALEAGRDEEYVVCALVHDIGDTLCPYNHAEQAAVIVQPYVSEQHHWMVAKHGVFQGHYFFHFMGLDPNVREQYRDHPCFEMTEEFCRLYDQTSFDPAFKSLPLEHFEPLVGRVFAKPKRTLYKAS